MLREYRGDVSCFVSMLMCCQSSSIVSVLDGVVQFLDNVFVVLEICGKKWVGVQRKVVLSECFLRNICFSGM